MTVARAVSNAGPGGSVVLSEPTWRALLAGGHLVGGSGGGTALAAADGLPLGLYLGHFGLPRDASYRPPPGARPTASPEEEASAPSSAVAASDSLSEGLRTATGAVQDQDQQPLMASGGMSGLLGDSGGAARALGSDWARLNRAASGTMPVGTPRLPGLPTPLEQLQHLQQDHRRPQHQHPSRHYDHSHLPPPPPNHSYYHRPSSGLSGSRSDLTSRNAAASTAAGFMHGSQAAAAAGISARAGAATHSAGASPLVHGNPSDQPPPQAPHSRSALLEAVGYGKGSIRSILDVAMARAARARSGPPAVIMPNSTNSYTAVAQLPSPLAAELVQSQPRRATQDEVVAGHSETSMPRPSPFGLTQQAPAVLAATRSCEGGDITPGDSTTVGFSSLLYTTAAANSGGSGSGSGGAALSAAALLPAELALYQAVCLAGRHAFLGARVALEPPHISRVGPCLAPGTPNAPVGSNMAIAELRCSGASVLAAWDISVYGASMALAADSCRRVAARVRGVTLVHESCMQVGSGRAGAGPGGAGTGTGGVGARMARGGSAGAVDPSGTADIVIRGGAGAAGISHRAGGVVVVGVAADAAVLMAWALECLAAGLQLAWPEALLDHELGEEVLLVPLPPAPAHTLHKAPSVASLASEQEQQQALRDGPGGGAGSQQQLAFAGGAAGCDANGVRVPSSGSARAISGRLLAAARRRLRGGGTTGGSGSANALLPTNLRDLAAVAAPTAAAGDLSDSAAAQVLAGSSPSDSVTSGLGRRVGVAKPHDPAWLFLLDALLHNIPLPTRPGSQTFIHRVPFIVRRPPWSGTSSGAYNRAPAAAAPARCTHGARSGPPQQPQRLPRAAAPPLWPAA